MDLENFWFLGSFQAGKSDLVVVSMIECEARSHPNRMGAKGLIWFLDFYSVLHPS